VPPEELGKGRIGQSKETRAKVVENRAQENLPTDRGTGGVRGGAGGPGVEGGIPRVFTGGGQGLRRGGLERGGPVWREWCTEARE